MKFIKKIEEYKLQRINEAFTISKKNIESYIESYYDKYESFSDDIKKVVNKYIFKNILETSFLKKHTINGILNKEEFNTEIKQVVDSASPENIQQNIKKASKEIVNKSINEFIYNNILKILTIRKRKEDVLCEVDSTTIFILTPFFIKFYLIDNISIDDLKSFYESLTILKYNPNYFRFLDFDKFRNLSFDSFKDLYKLLILKTKGSIKNDNYDFKNKDSGNIISYSLLDYIGKEDKEDYPSWWPFESGPIKPPSKDLNLSNYINNLIDTKYLFRDDDNLNFDMHILIEKIGDKLTELEPLFKIARFVKLMPIFINKNEANGPLDVEVNLKYLFYNLKSEELQNQTAQVAETNYRKGDPNKSKVITKKSMRYRNVDQILEEAEDELGAIVPTTSDTTLEEIDDINRKFGKKQGVEILWEGEDKLIVQVNSYQANYILNGEGTKYPDQRRSSHCIAWPNGQNYWNSYVGSEGPIGKEYKLQFYIYNFTKEARKNNRWTIGISLGLLKNIIDGACQDSKNFFINKEDLNNYLKKENIPFFQVLDRIVPNDKGTKYENMTLFKKNITIKEKEIETNKKFKSGNLSIEEIKEIVAEGADINAYNGILIRKSIDNFEKLKILVLLGASVQYLYLDLDLIIQSNYFELLNYAIQNGLDVSDYNISKDLVKNYDIFKLITNNWKQSFTMQNISSQIFDSITDIRILFLLYNKDYDFKKALEMDVNGESRKSSFISNNQNNYPIIKYLLDKLFPKYNEEINFNIFPSNINVYHLFILHGFPLNYQDSACLYNISKAYLKNNNLKNDLDSILNSFITKTITYKKSCSTCNGYGSNKEDTCNTCEGTGLSNELATFNSYIHKNNNLFASAPYNKLLEDTYFSDKLFNTIVMLKTTGIDVDIDIFEDYLELASENDILKHKSQLIKVLNLYSNNESLLSKLEKFI